ncbi:MAG: DUF1016 family protein [Muribaculaceae bacterium]|nr:DUF1016 family protein [Muribaculaceae bacterium]
MDDSNKHEQLQMNGLYNDACHIIDHAQQTAYRYINDMLIKRNWLLGLRIEHEILSNKRAEYGEHLIKTLAKVLTKKYGKGFSRNNIYRYIAFYKSHHNLFRLNSITEDSSENMHSNQIVPTATGQFDIIPTVMGQSITVDLINKIVPTMPLKLSWSHYGIILQEQNPEARAWYETEAANEMWSTRTLQRNISSQYYYRLLQSQNKDVVRNEMHTLTAPLQDRLEYLKNPVIAEFLGFGNNPDYSESVLEKSILNHLSQFLMELGKGFAFVDRQKHIHTEKQDYYIDLVFYNYKLKCFVLIDLKTSKLTYQDVGQMDMYVKMFDDLHRAADDNPTIGLLLCADTDEDVAHYSVLNDNEQLFAAKYLTYLPTQEELRREIEQQKEFFRLQNEKSK